MTDSRRDDRVLVIDDRRTIAGAYVVRTYAAGLAALQKQQWDRLLLDHDLGDFSGPNGRERTGYDIACWLEQHPEYMPKEVVIISNNPVGRSKIVAAIGKFVRVR